MYGWSSPPARSTLSIRVIWRHINLSYHNDRIRLIWVFRDGFRFWHPKQPSDVAMDLKTLTTPPVPVRRIQGIFKCGNTDETAVNSKTKIRGQIYFQIARNFYATYIVRANSLYTTRVYFVIDTLFVCGWHANDETQEFGPPKRTRRLPIFIDVLKRSRATPYITQLHGRGRRLQNEFICNVFVKRQKQNDYHILTAIANNK